ncbi:MAG: hypothetical protein WBA07_01260 [Rivularia sp. (in: cyanobacteria)]
MSLKLLDKFTRHRLIFHQSSTPIPKKNKELTQPKPSEAVENK